MAATKNLKDERINAIVQKLGLSEEHVGSIAQIDHYFDKHRVHELFNELMTNVLQERPADARQYILASLKALQRHDASKEDPLNRNLYKFQEQYLQQEDFLAIFESYDVLGVQTVPLKYLEQAMAMVGCENASACLAERYPEIVADGTVNKVSFVFVLQEEHKRAGFSYK